MPAYVSPGCSSSYVTAQHFFLEQLIGCPAHFHRNVHGGISPHFCTLYPHYVRIGRIITCAMFMIQQHYVLLSTDQGDHLTSQRLGRFTTVVFMPVVKRLTLTRPLDGGDIVRCAIQQRIL